MASWSTFLDACVTRVLTVTGINSAARAVSADPEKIVKIPGQFPKALIHNLGGQMDVFNGEDNPRLMGITLVVHDPRGVLGGSSEKLLAQLSELVIAEFTHTRDDNSIRLLSDSMEVAEQVGSGEMYLATLIFSFEI